MRNYRFLLLDIGTVIDDLMGLTEITALQPIYCRNFHGPPRAPLDSFPNPFNPENHLKRPGTNDHCIGRSSGLQSTCPFRSVNVDGRQYVVTDVCSGCFLPRKCTLRLRDFIVLCGLLWVSPAHAGSPMAAQVCSLLASPSLSAVQSRMGTGDGCAWQWPNGQVLSVYVHIDQQTETAGETKQIIDMYLQNPAFKKTAFPICTGGDMVIGDFRNGKGPGGIGYTQCSGFVLTFSFQGADAQNHLPRIAKKLAGTTFAR